MAMSKYYQEGIETASREQIKQWQSERLVKTVKRVYENVEYYRNKMDEKGVKPEDIKSVDDLYKLPFLTKDDLREAYPYGLVAAPLSDCVRIQSTSGTTGRRVVAFYTQHDLDLWEDCCARAITAAGGTKDDVCQVSYGYGLFTGGSGLNGGSHKVGCLTLPMSSGNTDRQIQFMTDLGATILCCTPSYAAYLAESINERGLRDKIKLRKGVIGSERWGEKMRKRISDELGIELYDIYGLTEIYGPGIGISCKYDCGMHYWDDYIYIEIIDPVSGRPVPDGERGEIVISTLCKEGAPLIRYRTHDLSRIIPGECECASRFPRLDAIMGRTDDMMKIKGVNVFPSQIEEVLKLFPEISSEYQIRISHLDGRDTMRIYVETTGDVEFESLAERITAMVKSRIGFTPLVKVVEVGVLPRSEKKTKRVFDERYD